MGLRNIAKRIKRYMADSNNDSKVDGKAKDAGSLAMDNTDTMDKVEQAQFLEKMREQGNSQYYKTESGELFDSPDTPNPPELTKMDLALNHAVNAYRAAHIDYALDQDGCSLRGYYTAHPPAALETGYITTTVTDAAVTIRIDRIAGIDFDEAIQISTDAWMTMTTDERARLLHELRQAAQTLICDIVRLRQCTRQWQETIRRYRGHSISVQELL